MGRPRSCLIKQYVHRVRKAVDPNNTKYQLLLLLGPKPVSNANSLMQALGKEYGIYIPSATNQRKAGSASAWITLTHGEVSTVVRSISHGLQTSSKHYRAMSSGTDATKVFRMREALQGRAEEEEEQESIEEEEEEELVNVESGGLGLLNGRRECLTVR